MVDSETFIFLFADDTKAFRDIKTKEDYLQLQKDINEMIKIRKCSCYSCFLSSEAIDYSASVTHEQTKTGFPIP